MNTDCLEVFQQQVFVFMVQHGQHGVGIHVELGVEQDIPHASIVYQIDVLVIFFAVIPGHSIGIVLVVNIYDTVFHFHLRIGIDFGQSGDGFDAVRISSGLCCLGRFRARGFVFLVVEHVAHTVADGAAGLGLFRCICAGSISDRFCGLGRFSAGRFVFFCIFIEHVVHAVAYGTASTGLFGGACIGIIAGGRGNSDFWCLCSILYGCCCVGSGAAPA